MMDKELQSLDDISMELIEYAKSFENIGNHNFAIDLSKLSNKIRFNIKLLTDERIEYNNKRLQDITEANNNMMNALLSGINYQKFKQNGNKK